MGFFSGIKDAVSSAWDSTKDAVSSAWDSTKDAITDVTGVESLNTLLATGGLATVPANLAGKGILGEALTGALAPLTAVPQPPPGMAMGGGALAQSLQPGMSFGSGGSAPTLSQPGGAGGSAGVASLFGKSGYEFGAQPTSSALLQSNPEAYQYAPLVRGLA